MRKRPWPVTIVCVLFIVAGGVGFVYHLPDVFTAGERVYEVLWVEILRLIAIVCAVLLWRKVSWARWLALAWIGYHVYISTKHSTSEVVTHIVVLLLVAVLLYLPRSSAFYRTDNVTEI